MNACYAILEDNECAIENNEHLIAQAKAILAARQENANDGAPPELVVECFNVKLVLQQQVPLSQEFRDKLKNFM